MFDSSKLDAYLTGLCQARDLPGVSAAIMGPDGLEYAFNYGFRDGAFTRPVDNYTLFGVASMSKSMTALCACILACEGRLDLNAPVSDFFPEFELAGQPREAATVRTLAMHTAGIPPMEPLEWSIAMNSEGRSESDWLREMKRTAPNKMETIDQIIAYIAHCGYNTLGAPGEVMSYSNEGYAILSYIVDQAAGVPLEQFMQARIFDPLGMTRTILDNGVKAARALSGGNITSLFEVEDGQRTCDDCWSVLPPFRGCAMVKSTSRDMAAYYRMIANMGMHEGKQAIPAHAVDLLVGRYHPLSHLMTMCMGLNKREFAGHVVCEHAGGLHGVSSKGALLLGEGLRLRGALQSGRRGYGRAALRHALRGDGASARHEYGLVHPRGPRFQRAAYDPRALYRPRGRAEHPVHPLRGGRQPSARHARRRGSAPRLLRRRALSRRQAGCAGHGRLPSGVFDSRRTCVGRSRRHAGV